MQNSVSFFNPNPKVYSVIKFLNLSSSTEYAVRLVFFEANNRHDLERSPQMKFETKKCLLLSKYDSFDVSYDCFISIH